MSLGSNPTLTWMVWQGQLQNCQDSWTAIPLSVPLPVTCLSLVFIVSLCSPEPCLPAYMSLLIFCVCSVLIWHPVMTLREFNFFFSLRSLLPVFGYLFLELFTCLDWVSLPGGFLRFFLPCFWILHSSKDSLTWTNLYWTSPCLSIWVSNTSRWGPFSALSSVCFTVSSMLDMLTKCNLTGY